MENESNVNAENTTGTNSNKTVEKGQESNEFKFTQADIDNASQKSKDESRNALLKSLGFETEEKAKSELDAFKKWQDSQKSEVEKQQAAIDQANKSKSEAEKRAETAERKCLIMQESGNPKCINDIMAMVAVRTNDKTDFSAALKAVKAEYPSFFGSESNADNGTGSDVSHGKHGNAGEKVGSIGARLAKQRAKGTSSKGNPYFKH